MRLTRHAAPPPLRRGSRPCRRTAAAAATSTSSASDAAEQRPGHDEVADGRVLRQWIDASDERRGAERAPPLRRRATANATSAAASTATDAPAARAECPCGEERRGDAAGRGSARRGRASSATSATSAAPSATRAGSRRRVAAVVSSALVRKWSTVVMNGGASDERASSRDDARGVALGPDVRVRSLERVADDPAAARPVAAGRAGTTSSGSPAAIPGNAGRRRDDRAPAARCRRSRSSARRRAAPTAIAGSGASDVASARERPARIVRPAPADARAQRLQVDDEHLDGRRRRRARVSNVCSDLRRPGTGTSPEALRRVDEPLHVGCRSRRTPSLRCSSERRAEHLGERDGGRRNRGRHGQERRAAPRRGEPPQREEDAVRRALRGARARGEARARAAPRPPRRGAAGTAARRGADARRSPVVTRPPPRRTTM